MSARGSLGAEKPSRAKGPIGLVCAVAACAVLGCGAGRDSARAHTDRTVGTGDATTGLRTVGLRGADPPTVAGGRLVPARIDQAQPWGEEPGGGVRNIVGGLRVIRRPDGTILTEAGHLPGPPSSVVEVPERLGGGFLFATGTHLWQGASWLAAPRLLSVASVPIERVLVGLERVYLRFAGGSLAAIDPRDGATLDLGPLPPSPRLASVAATDAWHAVALVDLRGVLVTGDAGITWRAVPIPIEPSDAFALDTTFRVGGRDAARHFRWWRVGQDLQAEPAEQDRSREPRPEPTDPSSGQGKLSGALALAAAVTDGWPLADGTALIARSGRLTRVRLADGSPVEQAQDAFSLNPARCHPFSLATARDGSAFGFTCGEPRGPTRIYAWDAARSRLVELRRFDEPRQVNAFGNGALAVRGPCQGLAGAASARTTTLWCVMSPNGRFAERIVRGTDARLVVLSDGRTAVLTPPTAGDLATARLTVEGADDRSRESSKPVALPELSTDVARALRLGVWMDGFEERRPGWLSGWIDFAGSVLGIEIALSGEARLGEYIHDAGAPLVAGRWGFVWTASKRGFETTDGGMTWTKGISLPDPLAQRVGESERVCGPVGCVEAGWVRVGWGNEAAAASEEPEPLRAPRSQSRAWPLPLKCDPGEAGTEAQGGASRAPMRSGQAEPVSRFPDFARGEGPAIPGSDVGIWSDPSSGFGPMPRAMPLARAYAWGPRDAEWDSSGQWEIRWMWPWSSTPEARASAHAPTPWPSLEAARAAFVAAQSAWTLVVGDDPDHALLVMRHSMGTPGTQVLFLESGRAPMPIRAPTDAFETVETAARLEGRWYVATAARSHEPPATVLWTLDGAEARELARLPRVGLDAHPRVYLARRSDGRAVGIAVEGQPDVARAVAIWMVGVDVDSGQVSEPTALAPLDAGNHAIGICERGETGWVLDWPYPASVEIQVGERSTAPLAGVTARVRLSSTRACVESLTGSTDREAATPPEALYRSPLSRGAGNRNTPTLLATVYSAKRYFHLRCGLPP